MSKVVCVWLVVLGTTTARAQEDPLGPEPAAAELFRQGRALIKNGEWKAGCEKLELSMKRYPAPSTLMNIALCREHEGRVATAWALYRRALVLNRGTDGAQRREELDEVGHTAIAALEPRLPRILVKVVPAVDGARVTEGGRELPQGSAVPLDPGSYDVVATAPGHQTRTTSVTLVEGKTQTLEIRLEPTVEPPPPSPDPPPVPEPRPALETGTPLWVWLVGGTGLAMAGVAIGFGIDARLTTERLEERCGDDQVCDGFDPTADNARKNRGLGLAIGFGLGALGALTAATVGVVMSEQAPVAFAPWVAPGMGGLIATAAW